MATTRITASNLALELDGKSAGSLRSCQPASVRVEVNHGGTAPDFAVRGGVRIALGEMAAEADLAEPGPLVDWLARLLSGDMALQSGAVVLADMNFKAQRRIGFTGACLTALNWPVLDAADGKRPFTVGLRWLAERVDDDAASGNVKDRLSGKRKTIQAGNFRIDGLPFGGEFVTRIALPAISMAWPEANTGGSRWDGRPAAVLTLGELRLEVAARHGDAVRKWVRQLIADGTLDNNEALHLKVDMLDAALKKALATIDLQGCQLRGLDEGVLGRADAPAGLSLRFAVGALKLTLS